MDLSTYAGGAPSHMPEPGRAPTTNEQCTVPDVSIHPDRPTPLTSHRGAWMVIAASLAIFAALSAVLGGFEKPPTTDTVPATSESARVQDLLSRFPDADVSSVMAVVTRRDGAELTKQDLLHAADLGTLLGEQTGHKASRPILSQDKLAAVVPVPMTVSDVSSDNADAIAALRDTIARHAPEDLEVLVTGGPAFGADIASSFDGADFTLLAVTIGIVAVLLGLTYRSPVLWLLPVAAVGLADRAAGLVTAALGDRFDLQFDAGVISVLVFGAGTNYAILLISRYREQLQRHQDHRAALAVAWRRTVPAIVASNVTVVVALATLVLAVIPGTRGLGVAAAAGLLIALAAVLFLLPAVLAVCGRRVFWPVVPRPGDGREVGRWWGRVARGVVRRPVLVLVSGLVLLGVMATGLLGASLGLSQTERFRVPSESSAGLTVLSEHFPSGEAQPFVVLSRTAEASTVQQALSGVRGVVRVTPTGTTSSGTEALTRLMVVGQPEPGSDASLRLVQDLRRTAHAVPGAEALVGGPVAETYDARVGADHDLLLVAPLVLGVSLIVLIVLLRSLLAPVLLLMINTASAVAAIGAGSWVSRRLFGLDALDLQVPLLAFLFLVALGIDYTIFLAHRARTAAVRLGTRDGIVLAVARTGGVITSAGIVLAGVFAALGLLPLVTLGQLGVIVGLGVLVDTVVVRTLIVPAVFALLGDRIWWPGGRAIAERAAAEELARQDRQLAGSGSRPD